MANADELRFLIELEHDPIKNSNKKIDDVASRAHSPNDVALSEPPSIEGLKVSKPAQK